MDDIIISNGKHILCLAYEYRRLSIVVCNRFRESTGRCLASHHVDATTLG